MSEKRFHDFSRFVAAIIVGALVLVALALFIFQHQVTAEIDQQQYQDCTARRMLVSQHNALVAAVRRDPSISPSASRVLAELQIIEPQPCLLPNP
jgi:hypothetical protein